MKLELFTQFMSVTESGLDAMTSEIQRHLSERLKHGMDYNDAFRDINSCHDGKLSRTDFQRLLASVQLRVTPDELTNLIARFDMNGDGVVDYVDFLRFITGVCDDDSRQAKRVSQGAESFQAWCVEIQNKKVAKEGNIDSTAAWKLCKPKEKRIPISHIDKVLEEFFNDIFNAIL